MKLYILNVLFQYLIIVVECGVLNHIMYARSYIIGLSVISSYLGVHRYASKVDTGWIPDIVKRKLEIIRLWFRLGMMDNNRITKKIFLWDLSICKNNWSNDIKDIFQESGQMDVFNNRIDHNHFLCNLTVSRAREYLTLSCTGQIYPKFRLRWPPDIQ